MPKYVDIAEVIHARIEHGDYKLRGFPSHSGLVAELGVNSRTVTKALTTLIDRGVLFRQSSGRVDVSAEHAARVLHIGLLSPAWPSSTILRWQHLVSQGCDDRGWVLKPSVYSHWHDMAITESLRGMDGLFLISLGEDFPPHVLSQIESAETPVIILDRDASGEGLPCLRYWNPAPINLLVKHLLEAGHQDVVCLNTQVDSKVIRERVSACQLWASTQGVNLTLVNEPVQMYESSTLRAHQLVRDTIRAGGLKGSALLCTTFHVATGAMRGVIDAGLRPGEDIGVCCVEEWGGEAKMFSPSITSLAPPDMVPLMHVCLDYFANGGEAWVGPKLIQPSSMELFVGESTSGRASATTKPGV